MGVSPITEPPPPLPRAWETTRVGQRTLETADAASIRFAFCGDGPPSTRAIVPMTDRAAQLAASPAGPRLERALHRFASQADPQTGRENLRTITLAPDVDSVGAAYVRGQLEAHPDWLGASAADRRMLAANHRAYAKSLDGINGGFTDDGNIITMPTMSRMLLASVGAYRPAPDERSAYDAGIPTYLAHLLRHEVEHTVTPGDSGLEEGIAEALSTARPAAAAGRYDLPPAAHRYGRTDHVSAAAAADWGPHVEPNRNVQASESSNEHYVSRQNVVVDLLKLAGIDRSTRAGYSAARDVLQAPASRNVPGALADAIIAANGLDPAVREPLRVRIRDIDSSSASDPVAALRKDFGISSS
jgi:hypothetical protein